MARHVFIVGGTGQIGRALVSAFAAEGWQVTASHRGIRDIPHALKGSGARFVTLDRDVPGALASALRNGADALIDTVAFDEGHADQLLTVQGSVQSITVMSSISVYCDERGRTLDEATDETKFPVVPLPIPETQRTVEGGPATYSTRKVALERRLLDVSTCPVTILRPGAIHGPGSLHPREWWFVKRLLDGRRQIPLKYRGQSRFSTTSVRNLAALTLAAIEKADKRVLNAVDPEPLTVAEIGGAIARYMGVSCRFVGLGPQPSGSMVGESPWSTAYPFVASDRAACEVGYRQVETYEQAVPAMCDWPIARSRDCDWREAFPVMGAYPFDPFDYAAEDEVLSSESRGRNSA